MTLKDIFDDEHGLADWLDFHKPSWCGGFSNVYDVGEDCVLKVTEDVAYLSFFKLVTEHCRGDKHFPIIHDYWIINGCYYILTEKLEHHDLFISERAEMAGYYGYDTGLWTRISESLDKALHKLDAWFDNYHKEDGLYYDLRDSNVMQRKDGTLVITDPFSESEFIG